ncbi:hypothetical protein [Pseudoclavibacter helvolus]|uniref:Uncharacterized protein n=1 Tax=Pseudoclavibacter helvolus TaxID=255205 RepID=A0A7W4YE99_9MICO|nr:hypothetical protein [Pseudoclavibacter helvolus]MBB2956972.1 hypothetical protein [Pseudoclavibacter helvolus]
MMHLPFTQAYVRERATRVDNAYNPKNPAHDWTNPSTLTVVGFLDTGASAGSGAEPNRNQTVSSAELHLPDAAADVQLGDRIRDGDRVWSVEGFPAADVSPFTGWQPVKTVRLREVHG